MILLLFAAPFIFGKVDQNTIGHACAGYFITDMYLELDRDSPLAYRYMRGFCLAYTIGFAKELFDKNQDGTDLLAVITGSAFNITWDWIFNRNKHKRKRG